MKDDTPHLRVNVVDDRPPNSDGRFVIYWMTANRRTEFNHALQRAVAWAKELNRPLLVLETLSLGRWASRRHHAFVLQGMNDNREACERFGVAYRNFFEKSPGETVELLAKLSKASCLIVADEFPIKSFAAETDEAARRAKVRFERVDSNGLLPLNAAERDYPTAYAYRRFMQKTLPDFLPDAPKKNPLARTNLPQLKRLPLKIVAADLADLPIDHDVGEAPITGGAAAGRKLLRKFVDRKLAAYAEDRNHPDLDATSGLSPYLHFGHVSSHDVFNEIAKAQQWSPDKLAEKANGSREGWWGMSQPAEAFMDQLATWREVGFCTCNQNDDYDEYESLPDWAKDTLSKHAGDVREYVYSLDEFEHAQTHDPIWNAAQTQLASEGVLHNYMRMLWGKKIIEWTSSPAEALETMIELNNKYALDGQDPNSYSGIFWVLGRYDRPWGPERKIFGKIRYMSTESAQRKLKLREYVERYSPEE